MRIIVTGATGNIGSALLRRLTQSPEHQVIGVARRLPSSPPLGVDGSRVRWESVDLTDDWASSRLQEVMEGADAVVHLAWGFQPSHDIAYLERLGVGGTQKVVDAVAATGVPHLVHMSSVGTYSAKQDDQPVDESWPTDGIATSPYSRHKAAAERVLYDFEQAGHDTVVTRLRPGIVGQRSAGSALLRYGVPGIVPGRVLPLLPILPLDRGLRIPVVHADDVALAVERALERRVGGPFNLAADPPMTAARIAGIFGARLVHVPRAVLRPLVAASWRLHLQKIDEGWIDMGFAVPMLDCGRAANELDWKPEYDGIAVFTEVLEGMRDTSSDRTPVLRPRTVLGQVRDALRRGPISERPKP